MATYKVVGNPRFGDYQVVREEDELMVATCFELEWAERIIKALHKQDEVDALAPGQDEED